jgi:uncharacterized protein YjbJ (UPF0337 family)
LPAASLPAGQAGTVCRDFTDFVQPFGRFDGLIIQQGQTGPAMSHSRVHHCEDVTMNKDQVKGRTEEAKGKAKEIAGKVTGNKKLEREGKVQNTAGKVQSKYGDTKEKLKQ